MSRTLLSIFICIALTLAVLLVYWQVRGFDFVNYDDDVYVYSNPLVLQPLSSDTLASAFAPSRTTGNWHPLTWLSFMLEHHFFGLNPGVMHLTNVLLHLANTLLLFWLLARITGSLWPSAFVAALFALHPMHVESVAWVSERKDVLSSFLMLLTFIAYAAWVRHRGVYRYLLCLLLFACGLMAKPMLVMLPLLLLLLDYWPLNRLAPQSSPKAVKGITLGRAILEKVPFLALSLACSAITFLAQREGGALRDVLLQQRLTNVLSSYFKYIGKAFWPTHLSPFYRFYADLPEIWVPLVYAFLLVAITVIVIRLRARSYLLVGWLWFIITLIPVIGLVQAGGQSYADRYTYIPYIGLFIMLVWGLPELLARLPHRNTVLGMVAVLALTALGICAHKQTSYWKDSITLFSHAIDVTEGNYLAYYNRAAALYNLGRRQEAIADYRMITTIDPSNADAWTGIAVTCNGLGEYQQARQAAMQAVRLRPDVAEMYNNLGVACGGLGLLQDALEQFTKAISIKPSLGDAYSNLGFLYTKLGRLKDARTAYEQALKYKPDSANAFNDLAWLIATHPQLQTPGSDEAVRLAARACELAGGRNPTCQATLAAAYASSGRFREAVAAARAALTMVDSADPRLNDAIDRQLSFYLQGKPYTEPDNPR